ncbi:2-oxo-tetronate isomerase [Sphingomonas crusticola]|uniref:2-oxo-tetronate isomerase n=1 Tax=Sphingomonas crusticola TaxID=1697973 RepID=UPI000E223F42|nr:2-oxo-tetronate isomerase [Sphingomonas crusticola]
MVKLAANLSMMFTEAPFLERFALAADAGFTAVEMMFPYEVPAAEVADHLRRHGLAMVLFNIPAGDWAGGERGIGALPDRVDEFRAGAQKALDYARILACPRLHLMAGKAPAGEESRRTLIDNIRYAANLVVGDKIDILLEPINTRVDVPGYFYDTTAPVLDIIREAGAPNVKLQYDIYHMQIMEGDLARTIERLLPSIGHIQLADNPGRGEPGTGEINYSWLLEHIDRLGYDGYVGCEYKPAAQTQDGLGWTKPYLKGQSQ